jgi:hypothetical protein
MTGIQNCISNLAGIIAPLVTGIIVSKTDSFLLVFLAVFIMAFCGAGCYFSLVGRVERDLWTPRVAIGRSSDSGLKKDCTTSLRIASRRRANSRRN